jgi:membrane-associated protease RseP (regulator of RpoE activity)
MINLDMVGRLNENKLTVGGIGTASEWKSLIESINSKNTSLLTSNNSAIDAALRQKGFDNVIVETNAKEVALKGTVPKGKLVEAIATAQEVLKRSVVNYLIETSDSISGFSQPASTIQFDLQLNQDGFGLSDHSSFYGKQIPVLFFFTGTHADYHKPSDTAEKINYAGLLKITNFVGEIVRSIDQNPKRPTYAVAQSSGMMSGRSGSFNVSLGTVPSYADSKGDGLLLDGVRDDSPAAKTGIKAGDKIVKMAGRDIKNISDYVFVLGEMKAGTEYEIVVLRGAETLTLKIIPTARK